MAAAAFKQSHVDVHVSAGRHDYAVRGLVTPEIGQEGRHGAISIIHLHKVSLAQIQVQNLQRNKLFYIKFLFMLHIILLHGCDRI
jgi:hypothetical protein